MAFSGAGAARSAAELASGINDAAKAYRQWKEINTLKNSCCQNAVTTKCGGDGTHCFIAGTLVKTADGDKPIEEISGGDEVLSYDVYTGECSYKKVLQVFVNEATELAHVEVGGEIITATTNHPFYVVGYGFLEAGRLQAGDRIRLANGEIQEIESIAIEHLEEPVRVYNFEVEDWHTYFVGERGVLVQNNCMMTRDAGESSRKARILYRGEKASATPDKVFEDGFTPKGAHNDALLHTKSYATAGNFISTTSKKSVAIEFAGKNGYVYVIKTNNYIDMNSTYGAKAYFPEQFEFSIPGGIKPSEILGVYKKRNGEIVGKLILNPNFGG